jgi:hypothetical protein
MAKRNRGNAPTRYSIVGKGDDYVFVCKGSPNGLSRTFGPVILTKRNRGNAPARYSIVGNGDDYVFVCKGSPYGLPYNVSGLWLCKIDGKTK